MYLQTFSGRTERKKRKMSPGTKLGAASLKPQRKNCNTQVKLRVL